MHFISLYTAKTQYYTWPKTPSVEESILWTPWLGCVPFQKDKSRHLQANVTGNHTHSRCEWSRESQTAQRLRHYPRKKPESHENTGNSAVVRQTGITDAGTSRDTSKPILQHWRPDTTQILPRFSFCLIRDEGSTDRTKSEDSDKTARTQSYQSSLFSLELYQWSASLLVGPDYVYRRRIKALVDISFATVSNYRQTIGCLQKP